MELLKPKKLSKGDTIGIFTPSSPSYKDNEELFLSGIKNIEKLGYKLIAITPDDFTVSNLVLTFFEKSLKTLTFKPCGKE